MRTDDAAHLGVASTSSAAMGDYFQGVWWSRELVQRGLGAIYFIAFLNARNQFPALLGDRGLLPVARFIDHVPFREAPSVFYLGYSDGKLRAVSWVGMGLALSMCVGATEGGPVWLSLTVWLVLWGLYLSIVNVGQTFYAFGWESMLVEAGFFAAFLGPRSHAPSILPVLMLRWMLFRVELGAGLIKLRSDPCWRNLTCLFYHHETQPLPNPLSWYVHRLPRSSLRLGVLFSHFVQLIVPFGLFMPQPIAVIAGILIIGHQLLLIVAGNYAWLNWLTIVLAFTTFSDASLGWAFSAAVPQTIARSDAEDVALYALSGVTALLSVQPALNLVSRNQRMNYNYNALHLVNAYGAFGSVTRKRYEIVLEGASDEELRPDTAWRAYELRAKPGDPMRRPRQIAPYHLRLDWLMWFQPFSVLVVGDRIVAKSVEPWFLRLVEKLLEGDHAIERLFRRSPFPVEPPRWVRARYYRYQLTSRGERAETGAFWKRELVGEYLPPLGLGDFPRREARASRRASPSRRRDIATNGTSPRATFGRR